MMQMILEKKGPNNLFRAKYIPNKIYSKLNIWLTTILNIDFSTLNILEVKLLQTKYTQNKTVRSLIILDDIITKTRSF